MRFLTCDSLSSPAPRAVGMAAAALGCSVDVCTLDGVVAMKVPPGTQPGRTRSRQQPA